MLLIAMAYCAETQNENIKEEISVQPNAGMQMMFDRSLNKLDLINYFCCSLISQFRRKSNN